MILQSVGRRVLLLVISACICDSAAACVGEEAAEAVGEEFSLSFVRSTTYIDIADSVVLQLADSDSLDAVRGSIRWSSDDTTVVSVDPAAGIVTGTGEGATRVWARVGADSASTIVVVEARVAMFVMDPRQMFFDAVGDLSELELVSIGRDPLPVGDLAPYCRSTDATVAEVSVGPSVRSVGNGYAYIRCEIAWTVDSVLVEVRQRPVRIAIVESNVRPIGVERDSITIDIATIDRLGAPIFDVIPTWRSLNARVLQIDRATGVVSGVSLGTARIVAEYEGFADTLRLEVRGDMEAEAVSGLPPATVLGLDQEFDPEDELEMGDPDFLYDEFAEERIAEPGISRTGAAIPLDDPRIAEVIAAQDTSVVSDGPKRRPTTFAAVAAVADHRVDIGTGTEKTSGPVFGAEFDIPLTGQLSVGGQVLAGELSAGATGIEDRTVTDFGLKLGYGALPWGTLELSSGIRNYSTTFSTQRWASISTGGRAHLAALDGLVLGHVSFAFLPLVSVSGIQSPSLGLQAGAGLDFREGRFTAGLRYELERFNFPARAGIQRIEQFAILRFRVGLALGGN
jgi:hypothetical protein